jgi:hypothetical protein
MAPLLNLFIYMKNCAIAMSYFSTLGRVTNRLVSLQESKHIHLLANGNQPNVCMKARACFQPQPSPVDDVTRLIN